MADPMVVYIRADKREVADLPVEEFCKRILLPAYASLKRSLRLDLDDVVVDFRLVAAPRTQKDLDLLAAMASEENADG